jgi:hypothetical protein
VLPEMWAMAWEERGGDAAVIRVHVAPVGGILRVMYIEMRELGRID